MSDLQTPIANPDRSAEVTPQDSDPFEPRSESVPSETIEPVAGAVIAQSLLRLQIPMAEAETDPSVNAGSPFVLPPLSGLPTSLVAALQHLLKVMMQLRSPTSGWPEHLPQTPENLAPYLAEESDELIDQLQAYQTAWGSNRPSALDSLADYPYILVEALIPRLLWEVARSSPTIMRLLGGIPVRVFQPAQSWQSGTLRLVPTLTLTAPGTSWTLDLALQQPAILTPLPPGSLVQGDADPFCPQPTWLAKLLADFTLQLQQGSAPLTAIMQGVAVDVLQPSCNWQMGQLQLQLDLEFLPQPQGLGLGPDLEEGAIAPELEEAIDANSPIPDFMPEPSYPSRLAAMGLRFTDADWMSSLQGALAQQRLAQQLLQPTWKTAIAAAADPASLLLPLVQTTCNVLDQPLALPGFEPDAAELELKLTHWIPYLLWQVTCSDYAVMRLVGGIPARYLQRECDWQTGLLRLRPSLKVQVGTELHWIDLSSAQSPSPSLVPLPPHSVVQSEDREFYAQPVLVETLFQEMMMRIQPSSALIEWLLQGTAIELQPASETETAWNSAPQTGWIQLQLDLEFLPDHEAYAIAAS